METSLFPPPRPLVSDASLVESVSNAQIIGASFLC